MPLLTLRGLTDAMTIDMLADPSTAWGNVNRLMRTWRLPVWCERGDAPRGVLPAAPVPSMVNRVQRESEQALRGAVAYSTMRARGERAAVDLLDDSRYRYRYEY